MLNSIKNRLFSHWPLNILYKLNKILALIYPSRAISVATFPILSSLQDSRVQFQQRYPLHLELLAHRSSQVRYSQKNLASASYLKPLTKFANKKAYIKAIQQRNCRIFKGSKENHLRITLFKSLHCSINLHLPWLLRYFGIGSQNNILKSMLLCCNLSPTTASLPKASSM